MLGYLDDEATINEVKQNSWLFTGDLAEMDRDGYIFITGRKKYIMKVNGNRFSPDEIEEVILQIPFVIKCSVRGTNGDGHDETIIAELEVKDKNVVTEAAVKEYCSGILPPYKVPSVIMIKGDE